MVETTGSVPIQVYGSCIEGTCSCIHYVGANRSQLMPCRAAKFLFDESDWLVDIEDRDFLWNGFLRGFSIVDAMHLIFVRITTRF